MRTIKEIKQEISKKQIELQKTDNYIKFQSYIKSSTKILDRFLVKLK